MRGSKESGERGSVLPLVAVVVAAAVLVVVFVLGLAERAVAAAQAQTAADAAALAAVYEGRSGAEDLADLNGAQLVAYDDDGPVVRVVVSMDGVRAEARAVLEWDFIPIDPREPATK